MRALAEWSAVMCESEYRPCVSAVAPPEMGGRKAGCENNRSRWQKSARVAFSFAGQLNRFCGPLCRGLNKGSRCESGADALLCMFIKALHLCHCESEKAQS